jgi:lipoprotein-anchoring transpeptidase ErfK/SrfK
LKKAFVASLLALSFLPGAAAAKTARAPAQPPISAEAVNNPSVIAPLGPKASGAAVLRAQILLDRARFSPGEIDGRFGSNLEKAVSAFQAANNLPASGSLDAETWAALNRDTAPALTTYVIAASDVAGPFVTIPKDMVEKSKLPAMGYTSAIEALGEKFHVSPGLLKRLNSDKDLGVAGTEILVPNVGEAAPLPKGGRVIVSKSKLTVSLVDTEGRVLAQFPATMGSERDPLPIGDWKVNGVSRNPVFHYNPQLFWDANPAHSKAKIQAGPNNPVGVAWIDLSRKNLGIHGTPEPSTIGKTQSHGCIRLTNWDAAALAQAVGPGTPAILQD